MILNSDLQTVQAQNSCFQVERESTFLSYLRILELKVQHLGSWQDLREKEIARRLEEDGVTSDFIQIEEGISRINLKLKSIDGTEINGSGPEIPKDKVEELMDRLNTMKEGDILFLAGSIPASMPDDIYSRIMKELKDKGSYDRRRCDKRSPDERS